MEFWGIFLAACGVALLTLVVVGAALLAGARVARQSGWLTPSEPVAPAPQLPHPISPEEFAEVRGELSAVRAEWKAHQRQLDAYLEAFEDLDESIARRQKRTISARSKIEAAEQRLEEPAENPNSREAARARARARGFRV